QLLRRNIQEATAGLGAQLSCLDLFSEDPRGGEAFWEVGLQGGVAEVVHVQASHVSNRERTEERQTEAEGGANQGVDGLGRSDAVLHQLGSLVEQCVLQAVQDETGDVLDYSGFLAGGFDVSDGRVDSGLGGAFMRNDFDTRDERRRVGEVHAQETLRIGYSGCHIPDGNRGGIGTDYSFWICCDADLTEDIVLDGQDFGHCFFNELRPGNCLFQGCSGREVLLEDFGGAFGEQPAGFEINRFCQQAFQVLLCDLCRGVCQGYASTGQGQHLADAAAHVT